MITKEVISDFVLGKKNGFDRIYEAYSPGMFSICLRYTRCDDDAQEVLQEAFIKIYNHRESLDQSKPIGAWIKTIVIRTALTFIKQQYRYSLTSNETDFDEAVHLSVDDSNISDQKKQLQLILNSLPEGYRTVFSLFAIDNLTHKEIAEYLGISEGTSKSQYSKAKKMIKERLKALKLAS